MFFMKRFSSSKQNFHFDTEFLVEVDDLDDSIVPQEFLTDIQHLHHQTKELMKEWK